MRPIPHTIAVTAALLLQPVFVAAIALLLIAANAQAASGFNVQPLRLDMSAQARSTSLELTNLTDATIPIQIKAYAWSQKDGRDVLEPTRDIFLAPPITNVKANAKQIIRFRLKKGADTEKEKAYRIFAEQIPPGDPALRAAMEFRIRFSLPLFVAPIRYSDPKFSLTSKRTKKGVTISMENKGNIHVKVTSVSAYQVTNGSNNEEPGNPIGSAGKSTTGNNYSLQGTNQQWFIPLPADILANDQLRVAVSTDFFNASGKGNVNRNGVIWLPVDGSTISSDDR